MSINGIYCDVCQYTYDHLWSFSLRYPSQWAPMYYETCDTCLPVQIPDGLNKLLGSIGQERWA